jgi:Holliday junction resolvase
LTRNRRQKSKRYRKKISFKGLSPEEIHELRSKMAKSNRSKGYNVENDTVKYLLSYGIMAQRVPHASQRGDKALLDIVANNGMIISCKRWKDILGGPERTAFMQIAAKYGGKPCLAWRDKGIHIIDLTTNVEMSFANEKLV